MAEGPTRRSVEAGTGLHCTSFSTFLYFYLCSVIKYVTLQGEAMASIRDFIQLLEKKNRYSMLIAP
jgi:hypothetical protein